MVISYLGGECFKITLGDLTLAFNPPSKDSSLKVSKFGSDIVFISQNHEDFNGIENASFGEREPFAISGPGEYEVKGVIVRGFGAVSHYGGEHINTLYSISLEGITLCFLGAFGLLDGRPVLPPDAKQEFDDIDILFLPIGGEGVLDYAEAYKLAVQLESKIIIPMHYPRASGQAGEIGAKDALKHFLKEVGVEGIQALDKLTIKKKDLEGKELEVIVLQA